MGIALVIEDPPDVLVTEERHFILPRFLVLQSMLPSVIVFGIIARVRIVLIVRIEIEVGGQVVILVQGDIPVSGPFVVMTGAE